jgi:excisionase family DNA binding protein
MTNLSTLEVARIVGIGRSTLERWLAEGKVKAPKMIRFGADEFRHWTLGDVQRLRSYKEKSYRKGRGRKSKRRSGP